MNESAEQSGERDAPGDDEVRSRSWHDVARLAAAAVVILAIVSLALMAIAAARFEPATQALVRSPRFEPPAPAMARPVAASIVGRPSAPPPERSTAVAPAPGPRPAPAPAPAPESAPTAPPPPGAEPIPEPEVPPARECALGLPPPPPGGGVASLTPLVPFFGPFSAEAFTMMPAFEPAFPVFAPLLLAGEPLLERGEPLLSALAPPAQELGQAGFDALAPLYAPYRQTFLDAEADFAAAFAPLAESLATAPGTECVVALEGMVVAPIGRDPPGD